MTDNADKQDQDPCAGEPPVLDPNDNLAHYWSARLCDVVDIQAAVLTDPEKERHGIYSHLVLGLVFEFWNGNKYGPFGEYPWRVHQRLAPELAIYKGGQYLGHNIACIAVNGDGVVIDFDFNHNEIFNSSAEHAEARLVRRVFSLAQFSWATSSKVEKTAPNDPTYYANSMSDVTIYTSLESCAQCSGIMTLGSVKEVVYLQHDPGQYCIGNIMYRLSRPLHPDPSKTQYGAPRPISGREFNFWATTELEEGYKSFHANVKADNEHAFFIPPEKGQINAGRNITSFLCTDQALSIMERGRQQFDTLALQFPDYRPGYPPVKSNAEALQHTLAFLNYAKNEGRRGTPHR